MRGTRRVPRELSSEDPRDVSSVQFKEDPIARHQGGSILAWPANF